MEIIDSHCHPQLSQYDEDRDQMISRSLSEDIKMICIGTDEKDSVFGVELANKYEGVWATVGIHPNDAPNTNFNLDVFKDLLKNEKVVAVGEIGLDYYRTTEKIDQDKQKEVFDIFLNLAKESKKPVIIHSRDAGKGSLGHVHSDMLAILKNNLPDKGGVAHSFTGTIDEARQYLELGFYLGFNGIITFAKQYNGLVQFVSLDRILVETDAPFLAPEPYRGKRNESLYVVEVVKKIAQLKNISIEEVANQTTLNCKRLFSI